MKPKSTPKDDTCESCKFWDDYGDEEDAQPREGACCRFPPVRNRMEDKDDDTEEEMHSVWDFPITGGHWWCGEFKKIK